MDILEAKPAPQMQTVRSRKRAAPRFQAISPSIPAQELIIIEIDNSPGADNYRGQSQPRS